MEEMWDLILGNVEKNKHKHTLDETLRRTFNKKPFHIDSDEMDPKYEAELLATMKRSRQDAARSEWESRFQSGPGEGGIFTRGSLVI